MFRILILVLVFAAGAHAAEEPKTVDQLLGDLEKLRSVGGANVGYGGGRHQFNRLIEELRPRADSVLVQRLLRKPSPVLRCMGLALLVDQQGRSAVDELRRRLKDGGPIELMAGGCLIEHSTVGGVARRLLHNGRFLRSRRRSPLLSAEELLTLDLDILARPDTAPIHTRTGIDVLGALDSGRLALNLPALRKQCPDRNDTELVRAVGRLAHARRGKIRADVRGFLQKVFADESLHDRVRLAAASGIALSTGDESRAFLASVREPLRKLGGGKILDAWVREIRMDAALLDLEKLGKTQAIRLGDPVTVHVYVRLAADVKYSGTWPDWTAAAFARLVLRMYRGFEVWDTQGTLPWDLLDLLDRYRPEMVKLLGEKGYHEARGRVRTATGN